MKVEGGSLIYNEILKISSKCWLSYVFNGNLQMTEKSQLKPSSNTYQEKWLHIFPSQMHQGRKIILKEQECFYGLLSA